jgi:aryl-alcohol dehydrogenase-like predicted oxidoreductase
VQLPINLLDRRLVESGDLKKITELGIKIHARSAFLQGLLLAEPDSLAEYFNSAKDTLKAFHATAHSAGVSPAHAALHYLLGFPEIEKIIIGVESLSQLENIFDGFPAKIEMNFDAFRVDQVEILNPILWG